MLYLREYNCMPWNHKLVVLLGLVWKLSSWLNRGAGSVSLRRSLGIEEYLRNKLLNSYLHVQCSTTVLFCFVFLFWANYFNFNVRNLKGGRLTHNSQRAQMLQLPFYLPSKICMLWVIRFHPSHRLFFHLRNHSTVSLTIALGDEVLFAAYFEQFS